MFVNRSLCILSSVSVAECEQFIYGGITVSFGHHKLEISILMKNISVHSALRLEYKMQVQTLRDI